MEIKKVTLHQVNIPFQYAIAHNLKSRSESSSIVIEIETYSGSKHYGEGTPRSYVIDEPSESIKKVFEHYIGDIISTKLYTIEDIKAYSDKLSDEFLLPSLSSAIEIARLDMYGIENKLTLQDILSDKPVDLMPYSGVITVHSEADLLKYLHLIKSLKLKHIKIKVGTDRDEQNIIIARTILGTDIDIRIDANRAWTYDAAVDNILALQKYNISCVEEPLTVHDIDRLPQLAKAIGIPIMLDESAFNITHATKWISQFDPDKLILNLKISKCGGPLRASQLYNYAQKHDISCQLGCNVGESAILSTVGRIFAQTHALSYLEGSYSKFFMKDDLSTRPLEFQKGGIAEPILQHGVGVHIIENKMQEYSQEIATYVN